MPGLTATSTTPHEINDAPPKGRNVSDVWAAQRVLHLDGERYAGLSGLFILRELMIRVSEIEKDLQVFQPQNFSSQSSPLFELLQPDLRESRHHASSDDDISCYRPCHYFDFISGTSLGGSCAIMLGIMRFNVDEVIVQTKKLLTDLDSKVPKEFMLSTRARNSSTLKHRLRLSLLEGNADDKDHQKSLNPTKDASSNTLSVDKYMCQTIVFTTQKAQKGLQIPFVLRSYQRNGQSMSRNAADDTTKISLVDACRASLSAPSGFESVKIQGLGGSFRDASVTILNPAFEAYNEVRESNDSHVKMLLCLGLNSLPTHNSRSTSPESQRLGDAPVQREAREHRTHFQRFADADVEPAGHAHSDPAARIQETERLAKLYCKDELVDKDLRKWAKRLVKYRRKRAETTRWNKYAGLVMVAFNHESSGLQKEQV